MSVRIPKYRLHKGSGQALIQINGHRIYLGTYNSPESKEKYRQYVARLFAPGATFEECHSDDLLLINSLILQYYRYAQTYYVKNGEQTDEVYGIRAALSRLRNLYGRAPAKEFGPKAFKLVREGMIQEGRNRNYINDSMARIRRMFKWGVAEELLPPSVSQALESVPGLRKGRSKAIESRPVLPLPNDILEATLPFLPPVVTDMVQFQRLTGCRPIEVCIIKPCDINRAQDVWQYVPESHKTEHHGRMRVIPIGPQAQEVLLRYLARDSQAYCFRPCDSEEKRRAAATAARVTPLGYGNGPGDARKKSPRRTAGNNYSSDSYRQAIHRACDKAFPHPELSLLKSSELSDQQKKELDEWQKDHHWSPNRLRHAAATEIRSKFGLEAAQVILGHSQANVTQVYAERDIAKGIEVAKQIG
jgi:integrase